MKISICAYCKLDRPATREHVIPSFVYKFIKEARDGAIGWNEAAKKLVEGEAKVKDVCEVCNSEILGKLDDYARDFLVRSGLLVQNFLRSRVTLQYDYVKLLRWLLKVSFNSSRVDGVYSHLFERHIPFILGASTAPPRSQIALCVALAAPLVLSKAGVDSKMFKEAANGEERLNPFLARLGYGTIRGAQGYALRINMFGAIVFYLLIFDEDIQPGIAASEIRKFLKQSSSALEVKSHRKQLELRAGDATWIDFYEAQVLRTIAIGAGSD